MHYHFFQQVKSLKESFLPNAGQLLICFLSQMPCQTTIFVIHDFSYFNIVINF